MKADERGRELSFNLAEGKPEPLADAVIAKTILPVQQEHLAREGGKSGKGPLICVPVGWRDRNTSPQPRADPKARRVG